jgi:glutathione S-transferase
MAPLKRARINFFTDTWNTKLSPFQMSIMKAPVEEKQAKVDEVIATTKKEIEPLLADAGPFFGGSNELTLAEAIVAPFLIRMYAFANGKYMPTSLKEGLRKLPNFGPWAEAVISHPNVTKIWDEEAFVQGFEKKYGKMMVSMD